MSSKYQTALDQGHSHSEIIKYLSKKDEYSGKINQAKEQGYSDHEIGDFLLKKETQPKAENKPERSFIEKAARTLGQLGIGAAESLALPYEIGVTPLALPGGQEAMGDLFTRDILSDVYPSEEEGKQVENRELKEPVHIGIRGLLEKITGLDLNPEGVAEKAAHWIGFIKDPKKIAGLFSGGKGTNEIIKAIAPNGREALRGLGAGTALEMAEQGQYGPIGTIAATIVGDLAGAGIGGLGKVIKQSISEPKKTFANIASKFTPKDQIELQKSLIKDFRDSGVQADIGTLTDSNLMKMMQARLSQSSLTGKAKEQFTDQIKEQYKNLAEEIGEAVYQTNHEGSEIAKNGLKKIRESDLAEARELYSNAGKSLKENSVVNPTKLAIEVEKLERELKPGKIKSQEQSKVLDILETLKEDIQSPSGNIKMAKVKDLMNNKIALNDIINYEVQGGTKQLLKRIVSELDRTIISHGKENIPFVRSYIGANKKFSNHAKTFRNKNINQMLSSQDPSIIMNKMNTVQGIKDLQNIFLKTPEGEEIFNNLKRLKFDNIFEKNLVDSTSQQIKLGTFSKILEKGNNKEIVKELMKPESFKRLQNLQKNSGRLADAANKFYNASKSGTVAGDAAIMAKILFDVGNLLSGNPWPLAKTAGGIAGARKLNTLISDPEFLKLVEEAIIAGEKNIPFQMNNIIEKMRPYLSIIKQESEER